MRGYGEWFWRLVERLASRICPWCSSECIRESLDHARSGVLGGGCGFVVRDAMLAAEAGLSWYPPPSLSDELLVVFRWAASALYRASVAEVYASRSARRLVASRGLWSRRVVERLLHDYWLAGGERLIVTDARTRLGWIAYPKLGGCSGAAPEAAVEVLEDDVLLVRSVCGDTVLEARVEPPLGARLRVESL